MGNLEFILLWMALRPVLLFFGLGGFEKKKIQGGTVLLLHGPYKYNKRWGSDGGRPPKLNGLLQHMIYVDLRCLPHSPLA